MSGMPLLALSDGAESGWLAGRVSHVSSRWNSHHSERMFSIPRPRAPRCSERRSSLAHQSMTKGRGLAAGGHQPVKMFTSRCPITCLTYSQRFIDTVCSGDSMQSSGIWRNDLRPERNWSSHGSSDNFSDETLLMLKLSCRSTTRLTSHEECFTLTGHVFVHRLIQLHVTQVQSRKPTRRSCVCLPNVGSVCSGARTP